MKALTAVAILTFIGFGCAGQAKADPVNCQTDLWGFFASQRRTICDTPIRADGSWTRDRVVWTPAHQVPFTCSYGDYYSSCSGGYFVEQSIDDTDEYPVTLDTVLPDEPGHLPAIPVD